jgi:transcriptional regulator with XRE-family HTH domain
VSLRMKDILNGVTRGEATPGVMLRAFRKREGFTQKDLEEITGIAEENISKLENDKMTMTLYYAETFAAALGVNPMAFIYPDGKFKKDERLLKIERKAKMKHG